MIYDMIVRTTFSDLLFCRRAFLQIKNRTNFTLSTNFKEPPNLRDKIRSQHVHRSAFTKLTPELNWGCFRGCAISITGTMACPGLTDTLPYLGP